MCDCGVNRDRWRYLRSKQYSDRFVVICNVCLRFIGYALEKPKEIEPYEQEA